MSINIVDFEIFYEPSVDTISLNQIQIYLTFIKQLSWAFLASSIQLSEQLTFLK